MDKKKLITYVLNNWDELIKNSTPILLIQNLKKIEGITSYNDCETAINILVDSEVFNWKLKNEGVVLSKLGREIILDYKGDYKKYLKNKNRLTTWDKITRVGAVCAILLSFLKLYSEFDQSYESLDYKNFDEMIRVHSDSIQSIQVKLRLLEQELDTINDQHLTLDTYSN